MEQCLRIQVAHWWIWSQSHPSKGLNWQVALVSNSAVCLRYSAHFHAYVLMQVLRLVLFTVHL